MKKLDKKQIPQVAALCLLSTGTFGYFVLRMVTPSPAAASTAPRAQATAVPATTAAPTAKSNGEKATPAAAEIAASEAPTTAGTPIAATPNTEGDTTLVPPPTPGMRDPFVVGYVSPKETVGTPAAPPVPPALLIPGKQTAKASLPGLVPLPAPEAPPLPGGLSSLSIRPVGPTLPAMLAAPPPAAPVWTVTGVLQNDTERLAILRNGEARRLVRSGDFVDSTYRVTEVTRFGVVLRHGSLKYRLPLGGVKPTPAAAPVSTLPIPTAPITPPAVPALPDASASAFHKVDRALLRVAKAWFAAAPCSDAAHIRSSRPVLPATMRFLDDADDAGTPSR